MKCVKLIVAYPVPKDVALFEGRYVSEHVPMAVEKLKGKIKFEASVVRSAAGKLVSPYHRMAEVYFPSLELLNECLASEGGKATAAHAVEISTGGVPLFLVADVEETSF